MAPSVLIIDDSPDIHRLLAVRLRTEGVALHHAMDSMSGLELAVAVQPDLILLDLVMPGTGGLEVCRALKENPQTQDIPVIFLSGTTDPEVKVQGFDLGAIDYVTKPFEVCELRARVRSALRMKRAHDLLAARAFIDALTGLHNRAYFDRRLSDELAASRRYGRDVSLLMVDIDHFKQVNDLHGHPAGDRVLGAVGDALTQYSRETDVACRYGGEEFALILTETPAASALIRAERLLATFRSLPTPIRGQLLTCSIGLAATDMFAAGELEPAAFVAAADGALYTAKKLGRDRVCTASPLARRLSTAS